MLGPTGRFWHGRTGTWVSQGRFQVLLGPLPLVSGAMLASFWNSVAGTGLVAGVAGAIGGAGTFAILANVGTCWNHGEAKASRSAPCIWSLSNLFSWSWIWAISSKVSGFGAIALAELE